MAWRLKSLNIVCAWSCQFKTAELSSWEGPSMMDHRSQLLLSWDSQPFQVFLLFSCQSTLQTQCIQCNASWEGGVGVGLISWWGYSLVKTDELGMGVDWVQRSIDHVHWNTRKRVSNKKPDAEKWSEVKQHILQLVLLRCCISHEVYAPPPTHTHTLLSSQSQMD